MPLGIRTTLVAATDWIRLDTDKHFQTQPNTDEEAARIESQEMTQNARHVAAQSTRLQTMPNARPMAAKFARQQISPRARSFPLYQTSLEGGGLNQAKGGAWLRPP